MMEQYLKKRVTLHERVPVVASAVMTTERKILNQVFEQAQQEDSSCEIEFVGEKPETSVKKILGQKQSYADKFGKVAAITEVEKRRKE